ncbi:MAG: TIR domain-containing protein [Planctomycetota bacterium]
MRNVIFVCYSKRDQELVGLLLDQLRPMVNDHHELELFVDVEHLAPGERWHEKVQRAAEHACVAVLCVSPKFFNVDYVRNHELPEFVIAERNRDVTLLPAWLKEAAPAERPIRLRDNLEFEAAKRQGLWDKSETLEGASAARRDELTAQAARDILTHAEAQLAAQRAARRRPRQGTPTITVSLPDNPRSGTIRYEADHNRHVATQPVAERLPRDPGAAAYCRLFPENAWSRLIRYFDQGTATPIDLPLRVGIRTDTPGVHRLPWHGASYEGRPLHDLGWSVAFQRDTVTAGNVDVSESPRVLVICDPRATGAHHRQLLAQLDSESGAAARTRHTTGGADTADTVREFAPDVVYLHARATRNGGWCAADGDADLAALAPLGADPPKAALLALDGERPSDALLREAMRLADRVPFVALVAAPASREMLAACSRALSALTIEARSPDPVWNVREALRPTLDDGPVPAVIWWSGRGDYRTTGARRNPRRRLIARLLLDRVEQRADARHAIDEMISRRRRGIATVAFGEDGNLVEAFGAQMEIHLLDRLEEPLKRVQLHFEELDRLGGDALRDALLTQLGCQSFADLEEALTDLAPGGGRTDGSILILDLGARGRTNDTVLRASELEAFAAFTADVVKCAPRHVRVVLHLSVQISDAKRARRFRDAVNSLPIEPALFRIHALRQLDRVQRPELVDFLAQAREQGDFSNHLAIDVAADELMQSSEDGRFDLLVGAIDRAQRDHWLGFADPPQGDGTTKPEGHEDQTF